MVQTTFAWSSVALCLTPGQYATEDTLSSQLPFYRWRNVAASAVEESVACMNVSTLFELITQTRCSTQILYEGRERFVHGRSSLCIGLHRWIPELPSRCSAAIIEK
jgi:hypothetical protein